MAFMHWLLTWALTKAVPDYARECRQCHALLPGSYSRTLMLSLMVSMALCWINARDLQRYQFDMERALMLAVHCFIVFALPAFSFIVVTYRQPLLHAIVCLLDFLLQAFVGAAIHVACQPDSEKESGSAPWIPQRPKAD